MLPVFRFVLIVILLLPVLLFGQSESRLLRFPAVSENSVVFTYAGDLYSVDRAGGIARKITSDAGYEMFPRFSPDGKTIAFTGQYDGNTEVFTIPSTGGIPKRLTYTATLGRDDVSDRMGPNNIVLTWRDDQSIVYRSRKKSFNDFKGQLYIAKTNGGLSEELPFTVGGACSYSPDKKKLAMNRIFREFRTWKYYKGGMADDIWIFDLNTRMWENITRNNSQDIWPMWHGDKIFYLSDRDRTMNLFVYDVVTKTTTKLTNYTDYDVKFPSLGNDAIVFEQAGYIHLYNISDGTVTKISITIADDLNAGRTAMVDASKFINTADIGPDGNRLIFTARGDVWTLPVKTGIVRNLSKSSGSHERDAQWSPDGKYVAYISDVKGEYEIFMMKQDGSEPPVQLTTNGDTYKYAITWSPDSKKIMWSDNKLRLNYVDINTQQQVIVDRGTTGEHGSNWWSPDSQWIVFSRNDENFRSIVYLYDVVNKKSTPVTDGWYNSYSANFSDDGKYLVFVSDRDFNPIYSATEWNHAYADMSKIYLVTLAKATPSPFYPVNDEVNLSQPKAEEETGEDKKDKKKKDEKKPEEKPAAVKKTVVDLDGISNRIVGLDIPAGNYNNPNCIGGIVYYTYNSFKTTGTSLKMYHLKDKKETELTSANYYTVSANYQKLMVEKDRNYYVIDVPKTKPDLGTQVDLSNMKVVVNKKDEWQQIFNESWIQMRDFFWDPNMHGVDWAAMKKKYEVFLPYVNHRNDLTYIIGEMIGELNIGHAYTGGGDAPKPERVQMGLLGAELSRDAVSGYYRIDKILKGENWSKSARSPLTEIGVDVKQGDYIIAVNGMSTKNMNDIYESLLNTANKQVELTVNSKPETAGSKKMIVTPTASEANLYYYNWVEDNIRKVNEATNGEVGYIHIPNMGAEGLNEFVKRFYPQLSKKALIIDDRGNGGGNVSPMIIERLSRELAMVGVSRNTQPSANPFDMHYGPKVVLIDQYSASDGDIFPYRFKKYNMGKVIGKRSWGGVVGIRGSLPFVDGGFLNKPEFSRYDVDGKEWIMEGYGVDPDIVVEDDPYQEYMGNDQQLNKAIEVIKEEMKNNPSKLAPLPPYPKK